MFDLAVIGSGAGAFAASLKATEFGANVAMVEKATIGGTCVNIGCVPSKHLLHVSDMNFRNSREITSSHFPRIIENKDKLVQILRKMKYVDVLASRPNIKFFQGQAEFLSKEELKIGDETIEAEQFIIATGSSPQIIPFEGLDKTGYITSTEALSLKKLPSSMVVIGAGFVGLEIGQMYLHFGTKVTVLEKMPQILPGEEPEVAECLQNNLEKEGMNIHTGVDIQYLENENGLSVVHAKKGKKNIIAKGEQILMAVGRRPNTIDLKLDKVGVEVDKRGAVIINDEMKTSSENIWAAGDVTGLLMLETTAAKEGSIASENALKGTHRKLDLSAVPHAVFTNPQVASVGLTDAQVATKGMRCDCRVLDMSLVPKSAIVSDERGLIKMVIDNDTRRILGVHIVSPIAADMIHEAVMALRFKATIDDIVDTVHVFPTFTEAMKLVAESFTKDVSNMSCCDE
jgi:mercuric reductase